MNKEKFFTGKQNEYQKILIEKVKEYIKQSKKDGYVYAGGGKDTSYYKKGSEGFVVNKKTGEIKRLSTEKQGGTFGLK